MAACTELEIEEKSSDESSGRIIHRNDSALYNASSSERYNPAWNTTALQGIEAQSNVESETGDLKELSDDEFLHLLKEASTFNKPNNQESILLKQLRKEVAESDSCENVGRGEVACVSKRVERKCSKAGNSESSVNPYSSGLDNNSSTRTSNKVVQRNLNDDSTPVLLSVCEGPYVKRSQVSHHIVEIETNNNQWCLKPVKISSSLDCSNLLPKQALSNSCDAKQQWGEREDNTSNVLPKRFIHDFDTNCLDQTNSSKTDDVQKDRDGDDCTMVKLENEDASDGGDGSEESVRERKMNQDNLTAYLSGCNDTQGIELIELRRSKEAAMGDDDSKRDTSPEKQDGCEISNSKFYVNCNDVYDANMTFPLKLAVDERNGGGIIYEAMNEQLKRQMNFPCFSFPRTQQVHSFLSSFPLDPDNQLDYSGSALMSDGPSSKIDWNHRKHKRARNHAGNTILAENIAGHRGNEDIDSLVKFIEADKNDKVFSRHNNNANQVLKSNSTQDSVKRKVIGKEQKTSQNKNGNYSKKKSNTEDNANIGENNKTDNFNFNSKVVISSESESSDDSTYPKTSKSSSECNTNSHCLDINSNVTNSMLENAEVSSDRELHYVDAMEKVDMSSSARSTSPDSSGFVADFHSIAEMLPQQPQAEESGFSVVKKKQRKRHQGKRSENSRWRSAAARVSQSTSGNHNYYSKEEGDHGNGIMLLSNMPLAQRNQCGKQDSRRKSTSSVPHSEQSSADNSDLDSVHSLPVRGSAPHPTKSHPHTTPSSSSSTPQASYADIARMPVSSVSKLSTSAVATKQPSLVERCSLQSETLTSSANANYEPIASTTKLSDPSEFCAIKNTMPSKKTREINTQTEPLVSSDNYSSKSDYVPAVKHTHHSSCSGFEERRHSLQGSIPYRSKSCSCSKLGPTKQDSLERLQRPAVLMMGNIPTMETSDISFGIDINEILEISGNESGEMSESSLLADAANPESFQQLDSCVYSDADTQTDLNASKSSFDHSPNCDASEQVNARATVSKKQSSPCQELNLESGQKFKSSQEDVDSQKFNYFQIIDLFTREWKNVQREFHSDTNQKEEKVKFYRDSC